MSTHFEPYTSSLKGLVESTLQPPPANTAATQQETTTTLNKLPATLDIGQGIVISTDPGWVNSLYEGKEVWAYIADGYGSTLENSCNAAKKLSSHDFPDLLVTYVADPSRIETIGPAAWKLKKDESAMDSSKLDVPMYSHGELMYRAIAPNGYECIVVVYMLKKDSPIQKIRELYVLKNK